MSFSHFFINRPIFASVLSIVIVIIGAIAYFTLPLAQYPDVAPPTIEVRATYPGASPETIAKTVATPIEQEVNGVEGMLYMESQCTSDGQMTLAVTFELGTDIDQAQVLVQNRVAVAEPRLPEIVRRLGVITQKRSPDILMVVHLLSPEETYDELYISNYALIRVRDVLSRLKGVGDVTIFGPEYSMRAWLNPEKIASIDMTVGEVVQALQEQNVQVAAGVLGEQPAPSSNSYQLNVNTLGRLQEKEQFENVIIKSGQNGKVTRLGDVARVELGARSYSVKGYLDAKPAVPILVTPQPGSNAIETSQAVQDKMAELSAEFPAGLEYDIIYNPTVFIEKSIEAVVHTIGEAIILVLIVMLLFLQTWRATVIPLLAIPVSLIGTLAVMSALGFSLNNLSLFGLVLAIGIVVDDAIVVVENVERNIEEGLSPTDASHKAIDEVAGPVISAAVVLGAVFIPTAFIGGITGEFYRQFALTIAVSTFISAFNSLTLSPAVCALLLQPNGAEKDWFGRFWDRSLGWLFRGFNKFFESSRNFYTDSVSILIRRSAIGFVIYALLIGLTYFGFVQVPGGFIPEQDQGYLIVSFQLPDGASLDRTDAVIQKAEKMILDTPGIGHTATFAGFSGATRANSANAGAIFAVLEPFEERAENGPTAEEILGNLRTKMFSIQEAIVVVLAPPPVRGLGTAGGFKMQIQDKSDLGFTTLQNAAEKLAAEANKVPGLVGLFTTFRANTPQIYVDIDRTKAKMLNVPLQNVFNALQVNLSSFFVNDFNLFGRTYQVTAQAEMPYRLAPEDIPLLKTRSASGAVVPLGSIADVQRTTGADRVVRYNLFPAADLNGDTLPGFSSGQAITTMERLANKTLPKGMGFAWTDIAFQQKTAGNTAIYIFPLCVIFVFLALAAQYESLSLPLAVILIVPMCLLSAIAGVWLRGMDNNLLTKVGFVVLVGLAAKNAILIVEFAVVEQTKRGKNRFDAVVEACRLRLRPILMTSFAFILAVVPLMLASGAGAEIRRATGTAVFAGMLGVTFFGLIFTPIFYVVIMRYAERKNKKRGFAQEEN